MDETALPLHKCSMLLSVMPTEEEAELLRGYEGEVGALGTTEKFFLEMVGIPQLQPRLTAWASKQRLPAQLAEICAAVEKQSDAFQRLRTSQALHTVFGALLALGNRLNAGSVRAGATGFRLDASLLQIVAMRCAVPPGSLAAFLARHMERAAPGLLTSLAAELEQLKEAAKQPEVAEQQQELQKLSAELRTVRQTLAEAHECTDDGAPSEEDQFLAVMAPFVEEAEAELGRANERMEALRDEAEASAGFFCEDRSVGSACALLQRVIELFSALGAAHTQALSEAELADRKQRRAAERKAGLPPGSPAPGAAPPGSPVPHTTPNGPLTPRSLGGPLTPRSLGGPLTPRSLGVPLASGGRESAREPAGEGFEVCESSLNAILEEEAETAAQRPSESRPSEGPPHAKLRKLGAASPAARGGGASEAAKQAEELQAIFLRRASGMSMAGAKRRGPQ